MIIVYTRPDCAMCHATKIWLKRNEVPYAEFDVSVDTIARDTVDDYGYTQLPVVVDGSAHWSGFRIDKLAGLKVHHAPIDNGVIGP